MHFSKQNMLLYAVTDRAFTGKQTLYEQVRAALAGGVTCVQLREKHLDFSEFLAEAKQIQTLCRQYEVPFLINDNVEVAMACDADGVHLGQDDREAGEVRALLGPDKIIGVTAKTVAQAKAAEAAGANYIGTGAMFGSTTKPDAASTPWETIRDICKSVSIPIVAIGGITKDNLPSLAGLGVDGVALVSAIFAASDIQKECEELRRLSACMIKEEHKS